MGHHLKADDRNYWIIDWLSRQSPAEWHGLATAWDWEDGVAPLHWIIQQPECDRATALAIFWESDPEYFLSEDGSETPIADMDEEIVARWKSGQYSSGNFSFDPAEKADIPDESFLNDMITADMAMPVHGTERAPNYAYGLPEEIEAAWNEANGIVERPIWSPEMEEEGDEHLEEASIEEISGEWSVTPASGYASLAMPSISEAATPDFSVPNFVTPDFATDASAAMDATRPQVPPELQPAPRRPIDLTAAAEWDAPHGVDELVEADVSVDSFEDNSPVLSISPLLSMNEEYDVHEAVHHEPLSDDNMTDDAIETASSPLILPSILFAPHDDEDDVAPSLSAYPWKSRAIDVDGASDETHEDFIAQQKSEQDNPTDASFHALSDEDAAQPSVVEQDAISVFYSDQMNNIVPDNEALEQAPEQTPAQASDEDVHHAQMHSVEVPVEQIAENVVAEMASVSHQKTAQAPASMAFAHSGFSDQEADYAPHNAYADHYEAPHVPTPAPDDLATNGFGLDATDDADFVTPHGSALSDMSFDDEDNAESEEGEEASFSYDLKSLFAPGAEIQRPIMPPSDTPTVTPTEEELAARVAAIEADARVSSRIRSLRQTNNEEYRADEASGGLMRKMRSMLRR